LQTTTNLVPSKAKESPGYGSIIKYQKKKDQGDDDDKTNS
jgi:hypothetical protein